MAGGRLTLTLQCDQQKYGVYFRHNYAESNLTPQPAVKNEPHLLKSHKSSTFWNPFLLIFSILDVMNLKCNSSVVEGRQFPLLCQPKVAEIREMIMERKRRGNLMGGTHFEVTVTLMSHFCSKSTQWSQTHTLLQNCSAKGHCWNWTKSVLIRNRIEEILVFFIYWGKKMMLQY